MNQFVFCASFFAALLALAMPMRAENYGLAKVNPASLAEQDLAAQSRGDPSAALALYSEDAIVQYGGLCWTPCVGKAAIQKELERRVAAKNEWKVIGKFVSGNVAVLQTELKIGYIESSGVDRVVVWNIYEVKGDKIAVATLVGQRTDAQTAQFIKWFSAQPKYQ
ncbi:MAG: nuclear transport factor 2 family protein [Alphaproteobacteria bacterium]|nr:nuclear transport factor 2 family protein [Alphaproteobacteria bacterium]MBV9587811.1 nuclear transport factor 2 family protein [Alphaproteobacteria bacterium]